MIEINALELLGKRKVDHIPCHFSKFKLSDRDFLIDSLENWIRIKLKGRYFLKKYPDINSEGKLKNSIFVGFENHAELTHFILACPHLRRN
jgi:hypothetical protein